MHDLRSVCFPGLVMREMRYMDYMTEDVDKS